MSSRPSQRLRFVVAVVIAGFALLFVGYADVNLTPVEELGRFLYFDENLSQPPGQSCASCHEPGFGFADPDSDLPVSEGVLPNRFGGRNSPSSAYAMYAPIRYYDDEEELWIGGQFWDSRATGEMLGDPLADQALGPFLNPVEMNNKSKKKVISDVRSSDYAGLFEQVWGIGALDDVEAAYDQVALSIAAFERTSLFGQFTSKYDAYLEECLGNSGDPDDCAQGVGAEASDAASNVFSVEEWYGLQLFMDDRAMCSACHVAEWSAPQDGVVVPTWAPEGMVPPLFTDFTFDNLGVPKNIEYPFDPDAPVDLGLGAVVGDAAENGKFKVMTVRNIGLTAPYAHNGLFKEIKDIVHFYNTRDVESAWPPPEYPETVNTDELGDLGLTADEEDALVAFMMTLSDGYQPPN